MSLDDAFIEQCRWLKSWLVDYAYPLWWRDGADRDAGGFHERLTLDGMPSGEPRRARLQPRHAYAYSAAVDLGWNGPAQDAVRHAMRFLITHHLRTDGLIRTSVEERGLPFDETALLYDQASAMLGFAAAFSLIRDERYLVDAHALRDEMIAAFGLPIGFDERLDRAPPLLASSHLHLLEACLAWHQLGDPGWDDIAASIVELAIDRMLHPRTHVITAAFERSWLPLANDHGRVVEPGHQFAWGRALMQWADITADRTLERQALQLIDVAESSVHQQRQVVMNSLVLRDDMLIVHDGRARLWAQTERIAALIRAAALTTDTRYVTAATKALLTVRKFLHAPLPGLWHDTMCADGTFIIEPAPASGLYRIVCAIQECERYVRARTN